MLKYKAIPKYRGKIGMSQSGLSKVTGIRIGVHFPHGKWEINEPDFIDNGKNSQTLCK